MRKPVPLFAATALALLVLTAACSKPRINSRENFRASYRFSDQRSYYRVQIDDTTLKYTFYVAPETLVWLAQTPCYSDWNMTRVTAALSQTEVDDLAAAANQSGFLRLADTCGAGPGKNPSHGYALGVSSYYVEKNVVYLSGDGAPPPPKAFLDVGAKLAILVQSKFGRTFELPH